MPDNLPVISIPSNQWVDIYAASGITVGQPLVIENVGACDIRLAVQAAQPAPDHTKYNIIKRDDDIRLANTLGDSGAWAFCNNAGGRLSVTEREGFQPLLHTALHDGYGNPITSYQSALDVHIKETHLELFNELFHMHTGVTSTVAVTVDPGNILITLADASAFNVGDAIQINNGNIETTFPEITGKTGNDLTLDRPLDYGYAIGDTVEVVHTDLSTTAGTLASPTVHVLAPEPGAVWFVNRIILTMVHGTAGADDLFGDLARLTNGVVLRANTGGQFASFTNWKTNGDIRRDMYDVSYSDKAGGPGGFGTSGRGTFTRIGALVRLDGDAGDYMDVIVQDNITALDSFYINGQGYVERPA